MSLVARILRADQARTSRFHDANGSLHLSSDMFLAAGSTLRRIIFGRYPKLPWLTYPAIRRLSAIVHGKMVFEYGAGSSTEWLSRFASSVHSVENDQTWGERVKLELSERANAVLDVIPDMESFIESIPRGTSHDIYIIDCLSPATYTISTEDLRIRCLKHAIANAKDNSIFVIDNTDVNKTLAAEMTRLFPTRRIERLGGWVPGNLHPNETSIVHPMGS